MKISILTPTRERCEKAQRFASSVLNTASEPDNIELYFYVDNDDPQLVQYTNWHLESPHQVHIVLGEPMSVSKSWNIIAEQCNGDIMIMGNDDLVYRTEKWDEVLKQAVLIHEDRLYVAWFNDGINGEKHCAFPAVSREWYNVLGYFTPGIFEFIANDTWVFDIGRKLDRLVYIEDVYAEHEHFSTGKMQADETTMRNRRDGRIQRDLKLYEETDQTRRDDADKLRKYMRP